MFPSVNCGLFRVVAVEEVVRQAKGAERGRLPPSCPVRGNEASMRLPPLGDHCLLSGFGPRQ